MSPANAIQPASTRVSVARLAEQVVAGEPGVDATRGRGRWLTADGERLIPGVVVGEAKSGLVDVHLHLIAEWPPRPLPPLVAQLRRSLSAAAAAAGLGDRIGQIDVSIHDVGDPAEDGEER